MINSLIQVTTAKINLGGRVIQVIDDRSDFLYHKPSNAKQPMDNTIPGDNTIHCYFIQLCHHAQMKWSPNLSVELVDDIKRWDVLHNHIR